MSSPDPQPLVSRRRLILGGVALGAVGAFGAGAWSLRLRPAGPGLRVLSPAEADLIQALGEALFPPGNPIGVDFSQADGVRAVDDALADTLNPNTVPLFRHSLQGLDWAARMGHGGALTTLSAEDRLAFLREWSGIEAGARRIAVEGLKGVMGLAFFNTPEVLSALRFSSRCHP